ncbi:MAG: dihydroorotate dehydrogenase electron transfer subunit [Candidatus Thorarchaeota archaeon]|nr:dihydroorotate dehydrogenase electron transfer subunit [Candidatus Thorarchaeota archaeon]
MGRPRSVRIRRVRQENKRVRTLYLESDHAEPFQPGQFLMVWTPGIDEIPMSISYWEDSETGISVLPVGPATQALASMSEGDRLGLRGPFGNGFRVFRDRALVVGGGIGMAPLRPLIHSLVQLGAETTVVVGARTSSELLFETELRSIKTPRLTVRTATDDGSAGYRGLATQLAAEILNESSFDRVYTCGPEMMMINLYRLTRELGIHIQASLERHMKCGCGLCGTCAMDPTGDLVCLDGPVFDESRLMELTEFGNYQRDATGVKRSFSSKL